MPTGKVIFVGAGPGDPELVTVKGMEALRRADVVVYDRLVHPGLLAHIRSNARLVYVGKKAAKHAVPQPEINRLLVREALRGQTVVRLKGGDPAVFGRVGEEAQACRDAGVPFDIIPGVTSGSAAPMYAGIPLTHRDFHSSVTFVTGHPCEQNASPGIDWAALAKLPSLVIYMGVKNLPHIQEQLLAHGMAPDTPAALIHWGTVARQQTITGKLQTIAQQAQAARIRPPAVIVIGEVVRLREELNWHETKPLFGAIVACPVEEDQPAADWTWPLASCGSEVVPVRLRPQPLPEPLAEQMIQTLDTYRWLVFADRRQVDFFFRLLSAHRKDVRLLQPRLAAVGEAAAEALSLRGLLPNHVLPAGLSPAHIRRRLAASDERICFLKNGYRSPLHRGKDTFVSLGRLVWDETHPAAELLRTYPFDACAAADPYHLEGLAELAGDGWQDVPLYCFDQETARRAREMGWKRAISGLENWSLHPMGVPLGTG